MTRICPQRWLLSFLLCIHAASCYSNQRWQLGNHGADRRSFVTAALVSATSVTVGSPAAANGATTTFLGGPPMIKSYPDVQYLVPLLEMERSLNYLEDQLNKGERGVKLASALLNRFFQGGFLSNKNVFKGLCTVYIGEIRYDDPDANRIRDDQISLMRECKGTLEGLEAMQKPLDALAADGADAAKTQQVREALDSARESFKRFLSRVPRADVERVEAWKVAIAGADEDGNGKLDGSEFGKLSKENQDLYKVVGEMLN